MAKKPKLTGKSCDVDLVVYGSSGLDSISTPFGKVKDALGGSGIFGSMAASFFSKTGLVTTVGIDFPPKYLSLLEKFGIDTLGISKIGKTFRWEGKYEFDMNEAKTIKINNDVLEKKHLPIPESYLAARFLFLGAADPENQARVLKQFPGRFVCADTKKFWIENKRAKVLRVFKSVDLMVINDAEARELTGEVSLVRAGKKLLKLGPHYVVVKKGEHGALLFYGGSIFVAPGYPLETVKDPTGAGDSFAGAMMGYLAKKNKTDEKTVRRAVICGSAVASFNTEDFSVNQLLKINNKDIEERYGIFQEIRKF